MLRLTICTIALIAAAFAQTPGANYQTGDGQSRSESIASDGSVQGQYSYVDPNGKTITTKYSAGKDGFKVEGDHIPKTSGQAPIEGPTPTGQFHDAEQQHAQFDPTQFQGGQFNSAQFLSRPQFLQQQQQLPTTANARFDPSQFPGLRLPQLFAPSPNSLGQAASPAQLQQFGQLQQAAQQGQPGPAPGQYEQNPQDPRELQQAGAQFAQGRPTGAQYEQIPPQQEQFQTPQGSQDGQQPARAQFQIPQPPQQLQYQFPQGAQQAQLPAGVQFQIPQGLQQSQQQAGVQFQFPQGQLPAGVQYEQNPQGQQQGQQPAAVQYDQIPQAPQLAQLNEQQLAQLQARTRFALPQGPSGSQLGQQLPGGPLQFPSSPQPTGPGGAPLSLRQFQLGIPPQFNQAPFQLSGEQLAQFAPPQRAAAPSGNQDPTQQLGAVQFPTVPPSAPTGPTQQFLTPGGTQLLAQPRHPQVPHRFN